MAGVIQEPKLDRRCNVPVIDAKSWPSFVKASSPSHDMEELIGSQSFCVLSLIETGTVPNVSRRPISLSLPLPTGSTGRFGEQISESECKMSLKFASSRGNLTIFEWSSLMGIVNDLLVR